MRACNSKTPVQFTSVLRETISKLFRRDSAERIRICRSTATCNSRARAKSSLRLNGEVDLRFLSSFSPDISSGGSAQVNAAFAGTLSNPSITGRIHIENASGRLADFPTGLSAVTGDLIFDAARLHFENLTALAGGGTLHLTGSVNYTERPVRYDITARSDSTRIRYPEGMSWLTAGSLRLTGTTDGGLLSGRVTVERVTLAGGLEVAGSLFSTKEGITGPSTSSPFLRNLQFDIQAVSTPDARMQWPGAELEAEADLRVRGTWEHPIILGHIHVLSGDLLFHGNRYRVARGDINFANPFRLDPVLNVEASTTIQQYEITLNFNGPASKLTLAYRSDPPLPAQDIVTLAGAGADELGRDVAQRGEFSEHGGRNGAAFGGGVEPGRRAAGEALWDHEFPRRSGAGRRWLDRHRAERGGACHRAAASHEKHHDYLHLERRFDAGAGDSGRVQREPQRLDRGPAGLQRHVRYRREDQEAVSVAQLDVALSRFGKVRVYPPVFFQRVCKWYSFSDFGQHVCRSREVAHSDQDRLDCSFALFSIC